MIKKYKINFEPWKEQSKDNTHLQSKVHTAEILVKQTACEVFCNGIPVRKAICTRKCGQGIETWTLPRWLTGSPSGTNLFVGAAVYLSTLCASQWHWYPEDVESEAWIDACMDRLFICEQLKVEAWQSGLALADIPRDSVTLLLYIQVLVICFIMHVWFDGFDMF